MVSVLDFQDFIVNHSESMDKLDDSIVNHHKFRSVWLKAYTMYLDTTRSY